MAALNSQNLPMKPAVGGMPPSESRKISMASAGQRAPLEQAAHVLQFLADHVLPAQQRDDAERAEVHERVDRQVDEHRLHADLRNARRATMPMSR